MGMLRGMNQHCCYRCGALHDWGSYRFLSELRLPIQYVRYAYRTIPDLYLVDLRLEQLGDYLYLCVLCMSEMERGFIGSIGVDDLPLYINYVWVFDESVSLYHGRFSC